MKILLANKFYYNRGGDCVVTLNTERLLQQHGHEVAVFAMRYPENFSNKWEHCFASQVDFAGGMGNKMAAFARVMGKGDIKAAVARILYDFSPNAVHLHNIHSYLSPLIAQYAHERGCRVVWTLHDYKLLCPAYTCLRAGKPCELCFNHKWHVLTQRCMKNSLAASATSWAEAIKWNKKRLERYVDTFICPSQFMASKMEQGGFNRSKLQVLNNFAPQMPDKPIPTSERDDYYCYVGRLSPEKGLATLLKAASCLPHRLIVAGTGPLEQELRDKYAACNNIEFCGRISPEQVQTLLGKARFSVISSEWYENNPMGVIESLCAGTPVVGAQMGGIPELIDENSGIIYESGNVDALMDAISMAMLHRWDNPTIAQDAQLRFSQDSHYQQLMNIYQNRD